MGRASGVSSGRIVDGAAALERQAAVVRVGGGEGTEVVAHASGF